MNAYRVLWGGDERAEEGRIVYAHGRVFTCTDAIYDPATNTTELWYSPGGWRESGDAA